MLVIKMTQTYADWTQTYADKNTNYSRIKNELETNNKTRICLELNELISNRFKKNSSQFEINSYG
jgi:hypothetical protein